MWTVNIVPRVPPDYDVRVEVNVVLSFFLHRLNLLLDFLENTKPWLFYEDETSSTNQSMYDSQCTTSSIRPPDLIRSDIFILHERKKIVTVLCPLQNKKMMSE